MIRYLACSLGSVADNSSKRLRLFEVRQHQTTMSELSQPYSRFPIAHEISA